MDSIVRSLPVLKIQEFSEASPWTPTAALLLDHALLFCGPHIAGLEDLPPPPNTPSRFGPANEYLHHKWWIRWKRERERDL